MVDADGATVTPGLIDSHMHPTWGADLTAGVDLGGLDRAGVLDALRTATDELPEHCWVRGWNLDYKVFGGDAINGDLFERVVSGRPTAVLFYDLHTAVGTRAALQAAGLDGTETFGDASEIVVDSSGDPTGELREPPAYQQLLAAAPALSESELVTRSLDVFKRMSRTGLTGATIMDGTTQTLSLLDDVETSQNLPIRLNVALWHRPDSDDTELQANVTRRTESGRRWSCSLVKIFLDGVIDTGTAWLHEPDALGQGRRAFWPSIDRYNEVVRRYTEAGFQIATHAVGDRAVATALDAYGSQPAPFGAHIPHRIEHLEVVTNHDVQRLGASGVIASMQPLHMQWREGDNSDSWATRLGVDRAANGFRTRDILRAGGRITLGSDWPVAPFDPRLGMAWARLRRTPECGTAPVFQEKQRLTGEEALLGYTRWAAEALGRTDVGTIAVGNRADVTMFARDPVDTPADELAALPVLLTIVDGEIVHRNGVSITEE